MTDQDHATSGSFAHAFLPGLIRRLALIAPGHPDPGLTTASRAC